MKRIFNIIGLIALFAVIGFMFASTPARAAEEVITFKPEVVQLLKDKNGAEYVRMIYSADGEKNGIKFTASYSVNAYRTQVAAAKQFKAGDTIQAVVTKKEFQGGTYYTALGFKTPTAAKK